MHLGVWVLPHVGQSHWAACFHPPQIEISNKERHWRKSEKLLSVLSTGNRRAHSCACAKRPPFPLPLPFNSGRCRIRIKLMTNRRLDALSAPTQSYKSHTSHNACQHNSATAKIQLFTESDAICLGILCSLTFSLHFDVKTSFDISFFL